jgi:hypothetical protein
VTKAEEIDMCDFASVNDGFIAEDHYPSARHGLIRSLRTSMKLARLDSGECMWYVFSPIVDVSFNEFDTVLDLVGGLSLEPLLEKRPLLKGRLSDGA